MSRRVFCGLLAAAVVVGLAFRLARLDARPMHHDEANQAVKFGVLLEAGEYQYDQADHHGPSLYYLTLASAWIRGQHTLASLDETTLRVVPALFGAAVILLFALFSAGIGRTGVVAAAVLAAVSPALTFYSRVYIQEAVFAFSTLAFLAALGHSVRCGTMRSALACGFFGGLAVATKETWLIVFPAALAAAVLAHMTPRHPHERMPHVIPVFEGVPWALERVVAGFVVALFVGVIFYSSLFTNPSGVPDWVRSFAIYGSRGLEGGAHRHPWSYYAQLLAFSRADGVMWTEGLVLLLAVVGGGFALAAGDRGFWPRFLALYSLFAAAGFSLLPYKTPWNLLPFYVGVVAVAGYGAARLIALPRRWLPRAAIVLALAAGVAQLGMQSWRANFRYPADPRNPYVYAHTSPDLLNLVRRVADVSAAHPDGRSMLVKVVAGPYEQWPLPWYLRRMPRVGYWTTADEAEPLRDAPVVIASEENATAVARALGDEYISEYYGLRPGALLSVHIANPVWERFLATRQGPSNDVQ